MMNDRVVVLSVVVGMTLVFKTSRKSSIAGRLRTLRFLNFAGIMNDNTAAPHQQIETEPYTQSANCLLTSNPHRSSAVAERTPLYQLSDHYRRCVVPDRPPYQSSTAPTHKNPAYLCKHHDLDQYLQLIDRTQKARAIMRQKSTETQLADCHTNIYEKPFITVAIICTFITISSIIILGVVIFTTYEDYKQR